ncbi:unnamed protein product [Anisakis simplex]|uniref:Ovule protein n=1 Tax=Anisakis simplex TaxID=6269 RepID=A0A0M3KCX5_ANISI|nr:unnamed protein product [Anisakis simplex]
MLSVASNRYTPFYYDEAPSNDPFRSLPPSSPFTSYWQQQQERRPIIGANCYKHRCVLRITALHTVNLIGVLG